MSSKKDVSAIVSGMGLAMSLVTSLMSKARRLGCEDEDIHRLATPEGENLLDMMAEVIAKDKKERSAAKEQFEKTVVVRRVTVNYDLSEKELVEAGKYDEVSETLAMAGNGWFKEVSDRLRAFPGFGESKKVVESLVSEGFVSSGPNHGQVVLEIELWPAKVLADGKYMPEKELVVELEKRGRRPINFKELLAFGKQLPKEMGCDVVALGSVVHRHDTRYGRDHHYDLWPVIERLCYDCKNYTKRRLGLTCGGFDGEDTMSAHYAAVRKA